MILSIVTVTYKNNSELTSTLNSILDSIDSNLLCNIEVIVIDGANDPNVISIIQDFQKTKVNVKLISEKDKGIYDGMNKGISLVSGEYTIFMNSGDLFNDKILNLFLSKEKPELTLFYGDSDFYKENEFSFHFKARMNSKFNFINHNCFSHQAIFYPSALIKSLNGYNLKYKISSDFDLTWRCFLTKTPFVHLNLIVAKCALGGVSCNNGLLSYKDRIYAFYHSQHYLYAAILYAYYPIFFAKNRLVMLLNDSSTLKFYRKMKNKLTCQR